jgi:hypothetical protein
MSERLHTCVQTKDSTYHDNLPSPRQSLTTIASVFARMVRPLSSEVQLHLGSRVEALRWSPGVVSGINGPDVYQVQYDDGTREAAVPIDRIRVPLLAILRLEVRPAAQPLVCSTKS